MDEKKLNELITRFIKTFKEDMKTEEDLKILCKVLTEKIMEYNNSVMYRKYKLSEDKMNWILEEIK